jgi:NAD-dependent DNA ligase
MGKETALELPLETDGVVIKVNSLRTTGAAIGLYSEKSAVGHLPINTKPKVLVLRLNGITYQVGRTGSVTPVAELEPVLFSGYYRESEPLYIMPTKLRASICVSGRLCVC